MLAVDKCTKTTTETKGTAGKTLCGGKDGNFAGGKKSRRPLGGKGKARPRMALECGRAVFFPSGGASMRLRGRLRGPGQTAPYV